MSLTTNTIEFNFKTDDEYSRSIENLRASLADPQGSFWILKDRKSGNNVMSRHAIKVVDEKGDSKIELCMMGNTLYILAMRIAGQEKWLKTKKQPKEFAGFDGFMLGELPFESGYGELGITPSSRVQNFIRKDASKHAAAMEDYFKAWERKGADPGDAVAMQACKLAFAYFAMTIAEAARFKYIHNKVIADGGLSPTTALPILQEWVIRSSVKNELFPHADVAIAGIHENKASPIFKLVVQNLNTNPHLAPSIDDLAGGNPKVRSFLEKSDNFSEVDVFTKGDLKKKEKNTRYAYGYEFLLDAYFQSRLRPNLIDSARLKLAGLGTSPLPAMNSFKGLQLPSA